MGQALYRLDSPMTAVPGDLVTLSDRLPGARRCH
jgi:hypothetical protein